MNSSRVPHLLALYNVRPLNDNNYAFYPLENDEIAKIDIYLGNNINKLNVYQVKIEIEKLPVETSLVLVLCLLNGTDSVVIGFTFTKTIYVDWCVTIHVIKNSETASIYNTLIRIDHILADANNVVEFEYCVNDTTLIFRINNRKIWQKELNLIYRSYIPENVILNSVIFNISMDEHRECYKLKILCVNRIPSSLKNTCMDSIKCYVRDYNNFIRLIKEYGIEINGA